MKVRIEVTYHPEYEGKFEPYIAKVLDYPEMQGYGESPEEAVKDVMGFLEEHLGYELRIVREDLQLELAS